MLLRTLRESVGSHISEYNITIYLLQGVAEWKGKYDLTKTQLGQFGSLRNDYDTLLAAYNAMSAVAANVGQADVSINYIFL